MGKGNVVDQIIDSIDTNNPIQVGVALIVLLVGLVKCAQATSALLRFIYRHFLRPLDKPTKYGKWAIVTGATDGIGREYCNLLAAQGVHRSLSVCLSSSQSTSVHAVSVQHT